MKTTTFKLLFIGLLIFGSLTANADYVKNIHKAWGINKVKALAIENKFGHINFINDRDDSVSIDVVIEIEKLTGSKAEKLADEIEFYFALNDGTIKAKTNFSDDFKTNQNFSIVYTINIPSNCDLNVENKYGNVTLGDLNAKGIFEIKYGNIHGQNLTAPDNEKIKLELKYSNASFDEINNLFADLGYSKFSADRIGEVVFDSKYSVIAVDEIDKAFADSQYDNFQFDRINDLKTESKFTGWNIDNLSNTLNIKTQYGDVDIDHISRDFTVIDLENSYGNIKLGISSEASYLLESDTYYCKTRHNATEIYKEIEDNHHFYIKAMVGKPGGKAKVKIESKFGKVNLLE